jgi:hypothetical protein
MVVEKLFGEATAVIIAGAEKKYRSHHRRNNPQSPYDAGSAAGYFRAALTGSLTFSTVANSMFQSSPFTFSTLRM